MPANISLSVIKVESGSIDKVSSKLDKDGWEQTGSVANGNLRYYEKSGINITVLSGVFGTLVFPSGPIRGSVFGDNAVGVGDSSIGIGSGGQNSNSGSNSNGGSENPDFT